MVTALSGADTALKIDDLYLSGYLACQGIAPQGIETTARGRKFFVYTDDQKPRIQHLVDRFYSGDVEVTLPILRARIKDMSELIRG